MKSPKGLTALHNAEIMDTTINLNEDTMPRPPMTPAQLEANYWWFPGMREIQLAIKLVF